MYNPCEICGFDPPGSALEGCLCVRGRYICDKCWDNRVFVFGSNLAGRHGKGAAMDARNQFGAVYGIGVGRTGNAYAIPTKDFFVKRLPISAIQVHVTKFIEYANSNPTVCFFLTRIGCGLAGYTDNQIAPMFKGVPLNVIVPEEWKEYI